ncbi:hypothetical protein GT347_04510 [Xylophilus rhododendri]|uniref:Uncharacterized protein n=1 Tax=Xylophilus rhododendri TaxID=2697032 RepID=A0A857J363_9BURK|nr:hypothetical protein [Xylophilus rhododendri]QHI97305.1 hypothetical protein GT347_04510 [Xylophilus rhododendri]
MSPPDYASVTAGTDLAGCFTGGDTLGANFHRFVEELDPTNPWVYLPLPPATLSRLFEQLQRLRPNARMAALQVLAAYIRAMERKDRPKAWALLDAQARRHATPDFCTRLQATVRRWNSIERLDVMRNVHELMPLLRQVPHGCACRIMVMLVCARLGTLPFSLAARFGEERAAAFDRAVHGNGESMDWSPMESAAPRRSAAQWAAEPDALERQSACACFNEMLSWTAELQDARDRRLLTVQLLGKGLAAFEQRDLQEVIPDALEVLAANVRKDTQAHKPAAAIGHSYCLGIEALKLALKHYGTDDERIWTAFIDSEARRQPDGLYPPARHQERIAEARRLLDMA